ncbi:MAG: Smr/MutS family protein [Candidatus Uhrbacteria bacterium]
MGKRTPDSWVSPSFKDRQVSVQPDLPVAPLTPEQQLNIAMMVESLPCVDLHGLRRADVAYEVDCLLRANAGTSVRIIAGKGQGILADEVLRYLRELKRKKNSSIVDFRTEPNGVSFVVLVK